MPLILSFSLINFRPPIIRLNCVINICATILEMKSIFILPFWRWNEFQCWWQKIGNPSPRGLPIVSFIMLISITTEQSREQFIIAIAIAALFITDLWIPFHLRSRSYPWFYQEIGFSFGHNIFPHFFFVVTKKKSSKSQTS